jgi:hypothetical protein
VRAGSGIARGGDGRRALFERRRLSARLAAAAAARARLAPARSPAALHQLPRLHAAAPALAAAEPRRSSTPARRGRQRGAGRTRNERLPSFVATSCQSISNRHLGCCAPCLVQAATGAATTAARRVQCGAMPPARHHPAAAAQSCSHRTFAVPSFLPLLPLRLHTLSAADAGSAVLRDCASVAPLQRCLQQLQRNHRRVLPRVAMRHAAAAPTRSSAATHEQRVHCCGRSSSVNAAHRRCSCVHTPAPAPPLRASATPACHRCRRGERRRCRTRRAVREQRRARGWRSSCRRVCGRSAAANNSAALRRKTARAAAVRSRRTASAARTRQPARGGAACSPWRARGARCVCASAGGAVARSRQNAAPAALQKDGACVRPVCPPVCRRSSRRTRPHAVCVSVRQRRCRSASASARSARAGNDARG